MTTRPYLTAVALALALVVTHFVSEGADENRWRQYQPEGLFSIYYGVVRGPDGAMWIADGPDSLLLRYGPHGDFSALSVAPYMPEQIVVGADGDFYCTLSGGQGLLRITLAGGLKYFAIADPPFGGLALGTDGNVWFSQQTHVGNVSPLGKVSQYRILAVGRQHGKRYVPYSFTGIAQDAKGRVWFGVRDLGGPTYVGSLDPATGRTTLIPAGTCAPDGGFVEAANGAIWLHCVGEGLATITHGYLLTTYPMPVGLYPDWPQGLVFDAHGRLWSAVELVQNNHVVGGSFVEFDPTTHRFSRHDFPTTTSWPFTIAFAGDGSLWATTLGRPEVIELVR